MTDDALGTERRQWARQRRSRGASVWVGAAFFALISAEKFTLARSIARAHGISAERAFALTGINGSIPEGEWVRGYELAFAGKASMALYYAIWSLVLVVVALICRRLMRSQARIWAHVEELERGRSNSV